VWRPVRIPPPQSLWVVRCDKEVAQSQMRQQSIAVSSAGLRPKSDCSGQEQKQLYSKLQTRPLVRKSAKINKSANVERKSQGKRKNWSRVPDGFPAPRQTGWLTVGRKLTWTWTYINLIESPVTIPFGSCGIHTTWKRGQISFQRSMDNTRHDTPVPFTSFKVKGVVHFPFHGDINM
jgi:hypothetical protein